MLIRCCHKKWASFIAALGPLVLYGMLSVGALAQSAPPPKPSGSVNIHQVQIAFIGSGAMRGGTRYFRGRSYPFKLGGLGIGGFVVSTLDATGSVYNLHHWRILRAFTVRGASDGRWASTARATVATKFERHLSASEGTAPGPGLEPRCRWHGRPFRQLASRLALI
jgi:hypothetical protein